MGSCAKHDSHTTKTLGRDCLRAVEKLASVGIWCAAQLSVGLRLWLHWQAVPSRNVTESEYGALLSASPFLERVARQHMEMRCLATTFILTAKPKSLGVCVGTCFKLRMRAKFLSML